MTQLTLNTKFQNQTLFLFWIQRCMSRINFTLTKKSKPSSTVEIAQNVVEAGIN